MKEKNLMMYKGKKVRITAKGAKTVNIIDEDGKVTTGVPASEVTEASFAPKERDTPKPVAKVNEAKKPYFTKKKD